MAPHRRILLSSDTDGQDCSIHPCNASIPPPISIAVSDSTRHFSNALIAAVSIISAAFFLALTYYAVLRRRRRHRHPPSLPPVGNPTDDDDTSSSYSNDDERDHHIWHIRTVGLDESTIKSIGAYTYRHGELTTADCSVCLGEIYDGEMVRLLPKCGHAFHVSCIDTWLRAHVSCPLCRAHIVCPTSDVDGGLGSSDMAENTQSGVLEDDGGSEIRVRVSVDLSPEVPENSEAILRSVSMDSVAMGAIVLRVEQEEGFGEERKEGNFGEESVSENNGKEGNSSKEIGGSLSSSGMGFFSRLGRARSSSVLPL